MAESLIEHNTRIYSEIQDYTTPIQRKQTGNIQAIQERMYEISSEQNQLQAIVNYKLINKQPSTGISQENIIDITCFLTIQLPCYSTFLLTPSAH